MPYTLVTESSRAALDLSEAKKHLRVDQDTEDSLIHSVIRASQQAAENFMNRSLTVQRWRKSMDDLPEKEIRLERSPLSSTIAGSSDITITLEASTGGQVTVSSTKYYVDTNSEPGRVVHKDESKTWGEDVTLRDRDAVKVEFDAGYGGPDDVPDLIKAGMRLWIGSNYEHREGVVDERLHENPKASEALWRHYQVPEVG